ncbi:transposase, partial [Oleiphilus sp. HI0086]
MKNNTIIFVGLDTHKEFTEVAYCEDQRGSEVKHLGRVSSAKVSLTKMARQFESKYPQATLHFVYEAGPCGYWIYRLLTSLGHCCYVVAPSLIPKKPGQRVKTDKRDAQDLARLVRNGDLDPIYVPEPADEAIRDLSRARERAMHDLNNARFQLKALLLRNHINYSGKSNWSLKHLRWLTEIILPHPSQQFVLQEMIQT